MIELRFLVDQDVSPKNVAQLNARGHHAEHVAHVGLAGKKDHELVAYAFAHSLIIVTKNPSDFVKLAGHAEVHPGMILLRDGHLRTHEEWAWLEPVLAHLEAASLDPINKVIDVTGPKRFSVRDIPPP